MAGQLKIGGNVIATHAGTEGAGTVTLDSSTLTIGSNTTISGADIASATFPAGHILQVQSTSGYGTISTNSTSFTATGVRVTMNALKSTSSDLQIFFHDGETDMSAVCYQTTTFYHSINGGSYSEISNTSSEIYHGSTADSRFSHPRYERYNPQTTGTVAIEVYFKTNTGTIWLAKPNDRYSLVVMEVAG